MNKKFLVQIFNCIFVCTFSTIFIASEKSAPSFELINKSGYDILYRNVSANAPKTPLKYVLKNNASVILEKDKPYSIKRHGFAPNITTGWCDVPSNSNALFQSAGSAYSSFAMSTKWDESTQASITIYSGWLGWIFKGNTSPTN